jgi:hypothetical protein
MTICFPWLVDYDYICPEHLCWELVDLLWSISSWWPILICIHPCLSNETVIEPLRSNMEHKHVLFPLGGSMLELTCKFLKPTHLVWNKSGWWLQPSEKNITQMGLLFPRYGQIIKTFQTTNQKSSRIATNPPSKCKNPNQKHHPPSGPAHLSPCLDQQGGQVLFVS